MCRSVYDEFKEFGFETISLEEPRYSDIDNEEVLDVLTQVLEIYGEMSAKTLENKIHGEQPWREARGNLAPEVRCEEKISKETMRNFYKKQLDEQEQNSTCS